VTLDDLDILIVYRYFVQLFSYSCRKTFTLLNWPIKLVIIYNPYSHWFIICKLSFIWWPWSISSHFNVLQYVSISAGNSIPNIQSLEDSEYFIAAIFLFLFLCWLAWRVNIRTPPLYLPPNSVIYIVTLYYYIILFLCYFCTYSIYRTHYGQLANQWGSLHTLTHCITNSLIYIYIRYTTN